MAIEIVDLPFGHGDFPVRKLLVCQRVFLVMLGMVHYRSYRMNSSNLNRPMRWACSDTTGAISRQNMDKHGWWFYHPFRRIGTAISNVGMEMGNSRTLQIPAGKRLHNYGKSQFLMGKLTVSMVIFNSFLYVYQRVSSETHQPNNDIKLIFYQL